MRISTDDVCQGDVSFIYTFKAVVKLGIEEDSSSEMLRRAV